MHEASFSTLQNYPLDRLSIKEVRNCIITRSLLILMAKGVHPSCLYENLPLGKKIQQNFVAAFSVLKNRLHFLKDDQEYFFVFNPWGTGYYHWLTEVTIKFLLFRDELRKGTILLPEEPPHFVTDFLELFAYDNVEQIQDNAFFKKLNVVTNPHTNHYNKEHIFLLRNEVFSRIESDDTKARRKIYVSRKNARARKVVNEDEVLSFLTRQGFECLHLENTPFVEQVRLFKSCDALVTIHGAALTNTIFMPLDSTVIELYPKINREKDLIPCFYRLCNVLGQKHTFLFCDKENEEKKFNLNIDNIYVDLSELERILSSARNQ